MATLVKEKHGLLYDEQFQENSLIWSLTPSNVDCLRFERDGLRILHNKKYVTYTMKEPADPYCLIVRLDHKPITTEDVAGVIIFANTNDYAECQTYLASSPSTIGNNGEHVNAGYDLSAKYVKYSFYDEGESDSSDSPLSSSSTIETPSSSTEHTSVPYVEEQELSPDERLIKEEKFETIIHPETGYKDPVYKWIKLIKYNTNIGYTYQFFSSPDGKQWIEVGNVRYNDSCSIGFFLYSTNDENVLANGKFIINNLYIYQSPYITIKGINILQEFEIFDTLRNRTILRSDTTPGNGMVIHQGNNVKINTNQLVLPWQNAWIRIYPKNKYDETIAQYTLDNKTFGGDIFSISYDIKIFIDNQEVLPGNTYDLGILFTKSFKRNIVIYNNEDFPLANIKVSIVAFSEYYSGEDVVRLALYESDDQEKDTLEYNYNNYVTIGIIKPHTGTELIMKLSDVPNQGFYSVASKYRFKLLIE